MICGTVLSSVIIQQMTSPSKLVENCSDPIDLTGDLEEIDSEEYNDLLIDKRSMYSIDLTYLFFHQHQKSDKPIFILITPPPQV